jgi:long-chain acyl-CoA synthetase
MLIHEYLSESAGRSPTKEALQCGTARFSYGEIDEQAERFAGFLWRSGVRKGDRVAIYLENGPEGS